MIEPATGRWAGVTARISAWAARYQRELSDRVHADGDAAAKQHGWTVTATTGRFGFGGRTYRDPRFDDRRRQFSAGPAPIGERDHPKPAARTPGWSNEVLRRWVTPMATGRARGHDRACRN